MKMRGSFQSGAVYHDSWIFHTFQRWRQHIALPFLYYRNVSIHRGIYRNTTRLFVQINNFVVKNIMQISLKHLPVTTRVHALGRFWKKLHQRFHMPGFTRLSGHSLFTNSIVLHEMAD